MGIIVVEKSFKSNLIGNFQNLKSFCIKNGKLVSAVSPDQQYHPFEISGKVKSNSKVSILAPSVL
jgi:hypothetical protein